jgi:hypothetical protein
LDRAAAVGFSGSAVVKKDKGGVPKIVGVIRARLDEEPSGTWMIPVSRLRNFLAQKAPKVLGHIDSSGTTGNRPARPESVPSLTIWHEPNDTDRNIGSSLRTLLEAAVPSRKVTAEAFDESKAPGSDPKPRNGAPSDRILVFLSTDGTLISRTFLTHLVSAIANNHEVHHLTTVRPELWQHLPQGLPIVDLSDETKVRAWINHLSPRRNAASLDARIRRLCTEAAGARSTRHVISLYTHLSTINRLLPKLVELNPHAAEWLKEPAEKLAKGRYSILNPNEVYKHDAHAINSLKKDCIYWATHPFEANPQALSKSSHFEAYIQAQIDAARRGVKVVRIYMAPDNSAFQKAEVKDHLNRLAEGGIQVYTSTADPTRTESKDFVLISDVCVGYASQPNGQMLSSEYEFNHPELEDTYDKYLEYFEILLGARKHTQRWDSSARAR